jgi:TolB protein
MMIKKFSLSMILCVITWVANSCGVLSTKAVQPEIDQLGPSGYGFRRPVWSPDGSKIAITAQTVVSSWTSEVFVLDVSKGRKKSIMYTDNGSVLAIGWSPDGNQLLLASQEGGDWPEGIWKINADKKSSAEFLASGYDAAWSPDGKSLAVLTHAKGRAHQDVKISLVNLETKDEEIIFRKRASNVVGDDLAWSPSGDELIFAYGPPGVGQLDLYVLNVATAEARRITEEGENYSPSWSPDGNLIAYLSDPGKEYNPVLFIADKNNTCRQELVSLDDLRWPSWSPDGKQIAFISHGKVYLLSLDEFPMYDVVCQ